MSQVKLGYDTANEATVQPLGAAIKREPSHYRLAAHKYMLASRRGIIKDLKYALVPALFQNEKLLSMKILTVMLQ